MIYIILLIILLIFLLSSHRETFSIVQPYKNPYYPYTNPYSRCVEDRYGNIRCYAQSYRPIKILPMYNYKLYPIVKQI